MPVPPGFETFRSSPFNEHVGPIYVDRSGEAPVFGVEVGPHHGNTHGHAHGGFLMTVLDLALGQGTRILLDGRGGRTVSTNVDFLGPAQIGDWLTATMRIDKRGGTLAFASAVLMVGDEVVARASSVLRLVGSAGAD